MKDTLRAPPSEHRRMKKASVSSILITNFSFLCCGCFGYAAFGNETSGNLLTGFGYDEPYWFVDLANVCKFLHFVGAYQFTTIRQKKLMLPNKAGLRFVFGHLLKGRSYYRRDDCCRRNFN